jgi:PAS domain S-box-containing protein
LHTLHTTSFFNPGFRRATRQHRLPRADAPGHFIRKNFARLDRAKAELRTHTAAVNRQEHRQAAILYAIDDSVLVVDTDARIVTVNLVALQLLECPEAALVGQTLETYGEWLETTSDARIEPPLQRALRERRSGAITGRLRLRLHTGAVFLLDYSCTLIHEADAAVAGAVLVLRDVTEAEAAAEQLRQGEERFRQIFATMRQGVVAQDTAGRIIAANPAAERILCRSLAQMRGLTSEHPQWHVCDEQGEPLEGQNHPAMVALRTARSVHDRVISVHLPEWKEPRWLRVDAVPLMRPGETAPYVVYAIFTNITQLRLQDLAIRQSEQRLSHALAATGDGVWDWDILSGRVSHNLQWCELLGLTAEHLEHPLEFFEKLIVSDDVADFHARLQEALATGRPYQSEHRLKRADGTVVRVLDRGQVVERSQDGRPSRMVGSITDVTAMRHAEGALQASETKFRDLFALSPMGICRLDLQAGRIVEANRAFQVIAARAEADLRGCLLTDLCIAQDGHVHGPELATLAATGRCGPYEATVQRSDGEQIPVLIEAARMSDAEGAPCAWLILQDISLRKADEMRIVMALEQAEAANVAKGNFLANMSHEIRTPLNGVIGMANLALRDAREPLQRDRLKTLVHSAESLLEIINDILDFSKIESGRVELEQIDFALEELTDEVMGLMGGRLQGKSLELMCRLAPDVPTRLVGDPVRVRQILINLVGNAIKFTTKGEVILDISLVPMATALAGAVRLRCAVRDTGVGIPADKIPQLFEKFSQADVSTTRRFGGSGLGLAICRELAGLMDGRIDVQSELGCGSTFSVELTLGVAAAQVVPGQFSGRLLIVAHHLNQRAQLVELATHWGWSVTTATDGPAALAQIWTSVQAGQPFTAALLDAELPGIDGRAVLELTRGHAALRALPVLLLDTPGAQTLTGENLGQITKPLQRGALRLAFRRLLNSSEGLAPDQAGAPDVLIRRGARVLVVEDNVINQQVALGLLETFGLTVAIANDGAEAVSALTHADFDLVFMDMQMPVMDGVTATRVIRDTTSPVRQHDIPVIALTARAMPGDELECRQAGMNEFMAKPIQPMKLQAMLLRWLPALSCATGGAPTREEPLHALVPAPALGPPEEIEPAVFDAAMLRNRVMGNEALFQRMIQSGLEHLPQQLAHLRAALAQADLKDAARLVHGLKGAAANLGAEALRAVAARGDLAAKRGDRRALTAAVDQLASELARLLAHWQAL